MQSEYEILPHNFADEMVRSIFQLQVYQLGSQEFFKQHSQLQKLNMQAHQNYAHEADEWVSDMIDTHDKWDILIYNLVVCFTFRTQFSQYLLKNCKFENRELQAKASIFLYALYFHEAVICDMVACRAVDQLPKTKHLLELVDYCTYRLDQAIMNKFVNTPPENHANLIQELQYSEIDLNFKSCMSCFNIVRGLACQKVPLNASHKMKAARWHVKVAQILAAKEPIFERTIKSKQSDKTDRIQFYEDGDWRDYEKISERFFKINKIQGQLLISLLGLSMVPDTFMNQEVVVFDALKAKLNDSLIDQLPQLKELRLFYEKLCFSQLQQSTQNNELEEYQKKVKEQFGVEQAPERGNGMVIIDVVSQVYAMIDNYNLKYVKQRLEKPQDVQQKENANNQEITVVKEADGVISLKSDQQVQQKQEITDDQIKKCITKEIYQRIQKFSIQTQTLEDEYDKVFPMCAICKQTAQFRCGKCKQIWYCGRGCQIKDWKQGHKQKCGVLQINKSQDDEINQLLKKIEEKGDKVEY